MNLLHVPSRPLGTSRVATTLSHDLHAKELRAKAAQARFALDLKIRQIQNILTEPQKYNQRSQVAELGRSARIFDQQSEGGNQQKET